MEGKGRGIAALKDFKKGEFVVEYAGKLLKAGAAYAKEKEYRKQRGIGCFMMFFTFKDRRYW